MVGKRGLAGRVWHLVGVPRRWLQEWGLAGRWVMLMLGISSRWEWLVLGVASKWVWLLKGCLTTVPRGIVS